jgi:hypothetical protein
MSKSNGTTPHIATEPVLARAREQFSKLDAELLARLVDEAVASVAGRNLGSERDRLIAAHVTVARLVGAQLAHDDAGSLLQVDAVAREAEPAEQALAEHLHARLEPEQLLVAALHGAHGLSPRQAAQALALHEDELQTLLQSALQIASELTLAYHDELICEPAVLSAAHHPAAVTAAVREHLAGCRSCRAEYEQRVWTVLSLAGAIVKPLPPLRAPEPEHRVLTLPRVRGAVQARVPARSRVA